MHEVSLMVAAPELAEGHARRAGATAIHALTLRVGRLAGADPDALRLAFEVAAAGTAAEGAALTVETVEVVCRCPACAADFTPPDFVFRCPRCGRLSADVRRGRELDLGPWRCPDMEAASPRSRTLAVGQGILLKNDEQARRNRARFRAAGLLTLNVLSSPGSGKTALLERTVADLGPRLGCAVVVGDLATDNDARRLRRPGVEVVQINTGNVCHLEAGMVDRACAEIDLAGRRLLFIENVGNLVCPASYDLGEDLRVVLLSVTEGEDKPLKYPRIFKSADVVLVTKTDLAAAAGLDRDAALGNLRAVAPQAEVLEVSARTGAGLPAWYAFLEGRATHGRD